MRVAVVTGASSGIGAALCGALRVRGWTTVGLSRRSSAAADEHVACDVADRASVEAAAAEVCARHPQIDLLVNNAGIGARGLFLDLPPERLEAVVATNYLGSVWCLRAFLPALGAGAHVVNVVSIAGLVAVGPYSASKHAQLAFSRSLAVELAPLGIAVHTVCPGLIETPGFPQRSRMGFPLRLLVVDPPFVAERILDAVERGKREIVVPRWYRPAAWVQSLFPGAVVSVRARLGLHDT